MPYSKWEDINPALKSLRPKITVEQANEIARQAEAIGTDDKKNGWAIAVSQFKKTHTVRKGKWVKRETKEEKKENEVLTMPEEQKNNIKEYMNSDGEYQSTYGCISFSQLRKARQMDEMRESLEDTTKQFTDMLNNIMWNASISNKMVALQTLWDEFCEIVSDILTQQLPEEIEHHESEVFSESSFGISDIETVEELQENETQPDVVRMKVRIIQPGWGNSRDNNYYPAEMLRNFAHKFIGAKMFETEHKPDEKNTRTWVSTITGIHGFTEDGAPIANVSVHDPNFAQRVRNLNAEGLLDKMECSIVASGRAIPNFEKDGKKGRLVESIDTVSSVDWVVRAGAGGKALGLTENQPENMRNFTESEQKTVDNQTENAIMEEKEKDMKEQEEVVTNEEIQPNEQSEFMEIGEVEKILLDEKLPDVVRAHLMEKSYHNANELQDAITKEREYIKKLTGSGLPFGFNSSSPMSENDRVTLAESEKTKITKKYFNIK